MRDIAIFALLALGLFVGCSMTAGGDMTTSTTINPTVDTKFNNVGE